MPGFTKFAFDNYGAWVYGPRFTWKVIEREEPILCGPGTAAAVARDKDLMIFCHQLFTAEAKAKKSPREFRESGIVAGETLGEYATHLSTIMVHELTHWFGGITTNGDPVIDDQTALDDKGRPLYEIGEEVRGRRPEPSRKEAKALGWKRVKAYPGSKYHCRLVTEPESWGNKRFPVTDQSQAEGWQWRGSRCHRYPPNMAKDPGPMTHRGLKGPWDDYCCNGGDPDICEAWRDEEGSSACNIGVMGWLLSCRQNYMETVEVLYSTNTLMLGEVCMVEHLPFLIPPQRFEMMTSLEITWSLKTHYTANQDYDDMDESHLRLVFDLLSPSKFPALRRLYIWFAKDRPCWLNINGIETYQKIILEQLDLFVKERTNLQECGFALPRCFFKRILAAARGITLDKVEEWELLPVVPPHGQVWRDVNGDMTVLQLPYVDSYPKAPYHIPARDVQVAGYWILESSYDDLPTYRRTSPPPPCFCPASTSPYQHRALHRDRSRDNSQSPPYSPRSPHYSPLSPGFSPTSPAGSDQPCVFEIDDI
ncbi:hypothetical protein FVER53590_13846 [Fusarium verticillioides]|nr:hypothetical protein FVER53590_13846 [Fusarium verticillioides]